MENVRNHINIDLVRCISEKEHLRKLIARPCFAKAKIFNEHFAAIHSYKTNLKLNRPIYVGMCILDLAKHLMYRYDFYYIIISKPSTAILYTDTDSLILEIKTEDVYKDMANDKDSYDFSNYPIYHPLYSVKNKKVIGKF